MPPALSNDLKQRMVNWYYNDQMTMRDIAEQAECSIGLVSTVLRNQREFGMVVNPLKRYTGRPSYLSKEDILFLNTILQANPSLYLDEMQKKLSDVRGVDVSISTLSRVLAFEQVSQKRVAKAAAERDEELRTIWEANMAQYTDPELFVALDESAVDNKTIQRTHGWSPMGKPCVRRETFLRGVRYSMLPALSINGIIALQIFEGSVTKEKFLSFLETDIVRFSFCFNFHLVHELYSSRPLSLIPIPKRIV
jgi:transposase